MTDEPGLGVERMSTTETPPAVSARATTRREAVPHATSSLVSDLDPQFREAVNDYLETYIDPTHIDGCPECGGGFEWGIAWGAGRCHSCGWPGRLYHEISDRREEPSLICSATCNGYRVCEDTRGDHVPHDVTWIASDGGSSVETQLRCPSPVVPLGLRREGFRSEYRPPEIARFNLLLWVHPDYVEKRS